MLVVTTAVNRPGPVAASVVAAADNVAAACSTVSMSCYEQTIWDLRGIDLRGGDKPLKVAEAASSSIGMGRS